MAAVDCDPDVLVNEACCLIQLPWRTRQAIRILNWCAFLNGQTMDCDPQALVIAASNFTNRLSAAQMDGIETYLSCQIASGGGGGGENRVFVGSYGGNPPPFSPTTSTATADDTDPPFNHWVWNGSTWGPPY